MSCREHYVSAHGHAVELTPDCIYSSVVHLGVIGGDYYAVGWHSGLRAPTQSGVRGACEAFDELRSSSLGRIIQAPKSLPMCTLKNLGLQHW